MIDMRIGEYHITSEPRNYIVSLAKINDDGTPATINTKSGKVFAERVLGYYNSMQLALKAVVKDDMMRHSNIHVASVEQYARDTSKIDKKLKDAIDDYSKKLASFGVTGKQSSVMGNYEIYKTGSGHVYKLPKCCANLKNRKVNK